MPIATGYGDTQPPREVPYQGGIVPQRWITRVEDLSEYLFQLTKRLRNARVNDCIYVVGIVFADTDIHEIAHGLGRRPLGFEVVRRINAGVIYSPAESAWEARDELFVRLRSSVAPTIVDLRFW